MATAQLDTLLRHIHKLAAGPRCADETDRQFLEHFAARNDESAFTALVARHGPMVLRVCRRVLSHKQGAEDAFQPTFLVQARNSASIRRRVRRIQELHESLRRPRSLFGPLSRPEARGALRASGTALQWSRPSECGCPNRGTRFLLLQKDLDKIVLRGHFAAWRMRGAR